VTTSPNSTLSDKKRNAFILRFGSIYESSPWVAEEAFSFIGTEDVTLERISKTMRLTVDSVPTDKKLELLNLHPELADRVAIAGDLTDESRSEQTGAGLTDCSAEEFDTFQKLNECYRTKFGFPFIIAVTGLSRTEILSVFKDRINNSKTKEFAEAISQVHLIAEHRLKALYNDN